MDTTVEGVRKLSREGAIGFGDFANAMETGMAGAALESGNTTRGTLRNVGAAVSRLGAAIMEEIFPKIREWGTLVIDVIDNQVIPAWDTAVGWVKDNSGWLMPLAAGVGAMVAMMTAWAIATGAVGIAWGLMEKAIGMTVIGRIVLIVGGLIVALWTAWETSETFRNFVTTAWEMIRDAIDSVAGWITGTAVPWLLGAWESIKGGVSAVGDVFVGVWENYIQPAWQGIADGATWLWETILKPVFDAIATAWEYTGGWIFDVIYNVVLLAWDAMAFTIRTAWSNYIRPVFENLGAAWELAVLSIELLWLNVLKPVWDAVGAVLRFVWEHTLAPMFERIRLGWEAAALSIELIWLNILKPVWDVVASFVTDVIVPGIERGLALADMAWRNIANMFREPINWVINFVWNDGLKAAFDNVAMAIGSDARLPAAPTIPSFSRSGGTGRNSGAGAGNVEARAKGGPVRPGQPYLVGEEGPELIWPSRAGFVSTADQTRQIQETWSQANPPHGASVWDRVKAGAGEVVSWARGGLASAADWILSPLFNGLGGLVSQWGSMGELGAGVMTNAKDRLVEWIRGEDGKAPDVNAETRSTRGALPYVNAYSHALADAVGGVRTMQAFNQSMAGGHPAGKAVDFIDSVGKLNRLADVITQTGGFDRFKYMAWQGRIWSPDGGWRPQGRGFGNDPMHRWHLHAEWHDQGGLLQPGVSMLANGTGKPEPVLTAGQWRDISTLAAKGAVGPSHLTIVDANGELIGRMRVEADGRIGVAQKRGDRVGRVMG